MSIWDRLGIPPTTDLSAIKRAYVEQSKRCHPEDNPEGHRQLREAYRQAKSLAGPRVSAPVPSPVRARAWSSFVELPTEDAPPQKPRTPPPAAQAEKPAEAQPVAGPPPEETGETPPAAPVRGEEPARTPPVSELPAKPPVDDPTGETEGSEAEDAYQRALREQLAATEKRGPARGERRQPEESEQHEDPVEPEGPLPNYEAIFRQATAEETSSRSALIRPYLQQVQRSVNSRRKGNWGELFRHPTFLQYQRDKTFCEQMLGILSLNRLSRRRWNALKPYIQDWEAECPFAMKRRFRRLVEYQEQPPGKQAGCSLGFALFFLFFSWFIQYSMRAGFGKNGDGVFVIMLLLGVGSSIAAVYYYVRRE